MVLNNEDKFFFEEPIIKNDFIRCVPKTSFVVDSVVPGKWNLRISTWNDNPEDVTLNPSYGAPPLSFPINLEGRYKIFVGVRAVSVRSKFALSVETQSDSVVVTPPVVPASQDYDLEIELPRMYMLSDDTIKIMNLNYPAYLRYFKFVKVLDKTHFGTIISKRTIVKNTGAHFAFPGFCRTISGKLLVAARKGSKHVAKNDFGSIVLFSSNDTGKTWGSARHVLKQDNVDYRDPSLLSTASGTLLLTYNSFGKEQKSGMIKSEDEGKTWRHVSIADDIFSPNGAVEFRNRLYYCGNRSRNDVNFIDILSSSDDGNSWSEYSTVAMGASYSNRNNAQYFDEPSLGIVSDSLWLCGLRVDLDGYIYQSVSRDNGKFKTWTYPKKTGIIGTPPHIIRLHDGNLLCSYGRRKPPFGIRASIYDARNEKWMLQNEMILEQSLESPDLGYAKSLQLNDGTILSVYYFSDTDDSSAELRIVRWQIQ